MILLEAILLNCVAQLSFDNITLKELYNKLGDPEKNKISEIYKKNRNTFIDTTINWNNKTVLLSIDKGKLNRLGVEVKNLNPLSGYDSVIKAFIERVLLRLSYDSLTPEIINTSETLQIKFLYQGINLLFSPVGNYNELFSLISTASRFKLTKNEYSFVAEWYNDGIIIKMIFPNNYQLLCGENKKELDEKLLMTLYRMSSKNNLTEAPVMNENNLDSLPFLISEGDNYMNQLYSDIYYRWNGTDSILVFEKEQIPYSVSNLFLKKELTGSRKLELQQKLYRERNFTYIIDLNTFIDYFENDFRSFVGLENANPGSIEGTLVLSHKYFNFIHLLYFKTNSTEVFNNNGKITTELYTNIPMHNVANLFMDFKSKEVKEQIDIIIKNP